MTGINDWMAKAQAALTDPMITYKEDATERLPKALAALRAVLELADEWDDPHDLLPRALLPFTRSNRIRAAIATALEVEP